MADQRVTATEKDGQGDILALCNPETSWRRRSKTDAIRDIETGTCGYYVQEAGRERVPVRVVPRGLEKHLKAEADGASENNLDNLPDG